MDWVQLTSPKNIAGSLANWSNNSTVTIGAGGVADNIVNEAISWISTKLRHWRMLTPPQFGTLVAVTTPTPYGQDTLPIPGDLVELNSFYLTGQYFRRIDRKPEQEVIQNWMFDGDGNRVPQQPCMYYINQDYIQFDSPPDQDYAYAYTYYQLIPPINLQTPTNWITQYHPLLMRAACMIGICEWTKELGHGQYDRTYWEEKAMELIDECQAQSDRSERAVMAGPIHIGGGGPGYPMYGY